CARDYTTGWGFDSW
nr:immunoglobulin heavy chain junction region [Macaca mulatta]